MISIPIHCFEIAQAQFVWDTGDQNGLVASSNAVRLKQTHSSTGHLVSRSDLENSENHLREGDWLVTNEPKTPLGIQVADCTAILVEGSSAKGSFVAAIHAGWRGTAIGVMETCLESLQNSVAKNVWLSPSICQNHFEVGSEVIDALESSAGAWTKPSSVSGKVLFDLKGYQSSRLKKMLGNRAQIHTNPLCTFCQPELISYRRAKGELTPSKRQWAIIEMK